MGTTIDIDEATRNAILAALDERAARLEWAIARYNEQAELYRKIDRQVTDGAQRVVVFSIAALHETNMARLQVAEAGEPVPTLAEAVPWEPAEKSYHDLQAR